MTLAGVVAGCDRPAALPAEAARAPTTVEVSRTPPAELEVVDSASPDARGEGPDSAANPALTRWSRRGPFETEDALCAAYHEIRLSVDGPNYGSGTPMASSVCLLGQTLEPSGRAPDSVTEVRLAIVEWGKGDDLGNGVEQRGVLVVRTQAGWVPGERFLTEDPGAWDTRGSVMYLDRIERPRWVHGRLQLERVERVVISGGYAPDGPSSEARLTVLSCAVTPPIACTEALVAFGDGDTDTFAVLVERPELLLIRPQAWHWEREFLIAPDGQVRLGRCIEHIPRAAGRAPCDDP